ncbi:MAG: Ig-like domain-containing protein [Mycobacterium sp.]
MGKHRAVTTQQTLLAGRGPARFIGRVGALAVALGVGVAVASGGAIANADDSPTTQPGGNTGGVQSPAAGGPAGASTNNATSAGASHGVKVRKPRAQPMQQNKGGGAQNSTARHGEVTAADEGGRTAEAKGPKRRAVLVNETPAPTEAVVGTAPSGDIAKSSARTNAASTGKHARRENNDAVATRVRAVVDDTVTEVHLASAALVVKPLATNTTPPLRVNVRTQTERVSLTAASTPHLKTAAPPARPVAAIVSSLLTAVGITSPLGAGTGDVPKAPMPLVLGVLQLIRRELDPTFLNAGSAGAARRLVTASAAAVTAQSNAATVAAVPQPGDVASTPYGDLGQWMLKSNGEISNYGGAMQDGKTLLEPVNVIIVDTTSTTRAESIRKLNAAMKAAGFPASVPHTTGYQGLINGTIYGQQPSGFLQAFSNNATLQDHGRIFGPAPAENGQGFVWTGAFSTEGTSHQYLSFNQARNDLANALVASGAATQLTTVDMGNGGITGDHDGSAVVLRLDLTVPNAAPTATVKQNNPSGSTGKVTGKVSGADADGDPLTYTGMSTGKGTVTVTSTGSFTYTPTAAARHAAAATGAVPADKTDTFSITVSDEYGGATDVSVTVNVLPQNTAPSPRASVGKADPVVGTVKGSVAVTDADDDVVSYSASTPASGTVAFNLDGTFTYTPTAAARQLARAKKAIGTDKFTVTVDDGHGGVKTVRVTTTIAPTDAAPVADTPTVGAPATNNGAVRGSVTASDPDGDSISFAGSKKTALGSVSVSSKGTFTYTPTAAARLAAASNPNLEDTFTITVTDKYGAFTEQDVTVSILAKA